MEIKKNRRFYSNVFSGMLLLVLASCSSQKNSTIAIDEESASPDESAIPDGPTPKIEKLEPYAFSGDAYPLVNKFYQEVAGVKVLSRVDTDFNGDGRVDFSQYFHEQASYITRESADLDGNGVFDVHYIYGEYGTPEQNKIVEQHFMSQLNGAVNVWKYFKNSKLMRREVDRSGSGRPNLWEYYTNERLSRVEKDDNGDGKPDLEPEFKKIKHK